MPPLWEDTTLGEIHILGKCSGGWFSGPMLTPLIPQLAVFCSGQSIQLSMVNKNESLPSYWRLEHPDLFLFEARPLEAWGLSYKRNLTSCLTRKELKDPRTLHIFL